MALTQLKTSGIADDAVTEDKIANAINTARAANTAKDLTALSAANLTSGTIPDARFPATLPAVSAANLTNVPARTNLIINGAMTVAQRGADSTASGYKTIDRWQVGHSVQDAPYQMQVNVASGTTPYNLGFRKAFQIMNGNQTNGAGASNYINANTRLEARDIANSGWNYTDSNSFITLSFWVKSSVAQNFYGYVKTFDGSSKTYPFETGSLSANTWTKITKTIPGNSGLTFDNDANLGFQIVIVPFWGTDYTDSGVTLNQWNATDNAARTPDNTTTWFTTNDATLDITGVQLEVGSTASDFVHESYADTFLKCQRYYHVIFDGSIHQYTYWQMAYYYNSGTAQFILRMNPEMRATPTLECTSTSNVYRLYRNGTYDGFDDFLLSHSSKNSCRIYNSSDATGTAGQMGGLYVSSDGSGNEMIALTAEL